MLTLSNCSKDKSPTEPGETMDSSGEKTSSDEESDTDSQVDPNPTDSDDSNTTGEDEDLNDSKQVNQLKESQTDQLCKDFDQDFGEAFSDEGPEIICDYEAYFFGVIDYFFGEDPESATKTCKDAYSDCISASDFSCEFWWEPDSCTDEATVGMVRKCFSETITSLQSFGKNAILRDCESIVWEEIDLSQEDTTPTCTKLEDLCFGEEEKIDLQ